MTKCQDTQRQKVYTLDSVFWGGHMADTEWFTVLIGFDEWCAFANMAMSDGLARPYADQIRRTRKTEVLDIVAVDEPTTAHAYLHRDCIHVGADRLCRWIALHEVAHLLVPGCRRAPHYWRWMHVYVQMIQRYGSTELASQFLTFANAFGVQWRNPDVVAV